MDLEGLVGNPVYHSLACLDRIMLALWGYEGSRDGRGGGAFGHQLLWGLCMNFDQRIMSLPEPMRMKAKYFMAEPALQRGRPDVPLRLLKKSLVVPSVGRCLPRTSPSAARSRAPPGGQLPSLF